MNFKSGVILTAIVSILISTSLSYADEKPAQPLPTPAVEKAVTPPSAPASGGEKPAESSPVAVIPEDTYNFPMAMEGVTVIHDFTIQNKGTADLEVLAVKPG